MSSLAGETAAVPLRLVCARLSMSFPADARKAIACVANSCDDSLKPKNVVKAYNLIQYCDRRKIELSEAPDTLAHLARWLLCLQHQNVRDTIARDWGKRCLDDDIFHLLGLDPQELGRWGCSENGCNKSVFDAFNPDEDDWSRHIDIMETLTPSAIVRDCLSDEYRAELVEELVGWVHCHDHCTSENARQLPDKWIASLTEAIQRRKPENIPKKRSTPRKGKSKDALNQESTSAQCESEAEPDRRTSGENLIDCQTGSVDSAQPSGDLVGGQAVIGGVGQSDSTLSGSKDSGSPSGWLFGPRSAVAGSSSPPNKVFALEPQCGSGGVESSYKGSTAIQFDFSGFGSSTADSPIPRVCFVGSGSPSSSLKPKSVSDGNSAIPSASRSGTSNSGLLSPNSSPPSSRKSPASTADQTEAASPGAKFPRVFTSEDHPRHASSSRRTASPFLQPSPMEGAQAGSPVTNGLGHYLSAGRETAKSRSQSSSDIRVSGPQSQQDGPSQPRSTQSYPDLASESRNRGSSTEREVSIESSRGSSSIEAQEQVPFTAAYQQTFKHTEIDIKLLRYIRSITADNGKTRNSSSGDVYVLQNPAWPNHVKIGESGRDVDKRITELKKSCDIRSLKQVVDTEQRNFLNYKIVEKLCHEELKNFRKKFLCTSCKNLRGDQKKHQEWFQVNPEIAVRTVQKWRRWMSLSPYDGDGDLVPWWQHKANDELFFKEEPFDAKEEAIDDHDSRHRRWSRWLKRPTIKERTEFEIERFFLHTRPKRKSVWNRAEENLVPLLIYFFIAFFICGPKTWILLLLLHLLAF